MCVIFCSGVDEIFFDKNVNTVNQAKEDGVDVLGVIALEGLRHIWRD